MAVHEVQTDSAMYAQWHPDSSLTTSEGTYEQQRIATDVQRQLDTYVAMGFPSFLRTFKQPYLRSFPQLPVQKPHPDFSDALLVENRIPEEAIYARLGITPTFYPDTEYTITTRPYVRWVRDPVYQLITPVEQIPILQSPADAGRELALFYAVYPDQDFFEHYGIFIASDRELPNGQTQTYVRSLHKSSEGSGMVMDMTIDQNVDVVWIPLIRHDESAM